MNTAFLYKMQTNTIEIQTHSYSLILLNPGFEANL